MKKMAEKMSTMDWVAFTLVIVGALNWLLVAFNFNLVNLLFGTIPMLEKLVYVLVGISALYMVYSATKK